jgi:hypothetical protein
MPRSLLYHFRRRRYKRYRALPQVQDERVFSKERETEETVDFLCHKIGGFAHHDWHVTEDQIIDHNAVYTTTVYFNIMTVGANNGNAPGELEVCFDVVLEGMAEPVYLGAAVQPQPLHRDCRYAPR